MNDVIKEITAIDQLAFDTREENKQLIEKRKEEYEKQITLHMTSILSEADERVKIIYDEQIERTKEEIQSLNKSYLEQNEKLIKAYDAIEKQQLEKVFKQLLELGETQWMDL